MRIATFLVSALLLAGLSASGCEKELQHSYSDSSPDDPTPSPIPTTPPERTNRIDGTVHGRAFGPIQTALLTYTDNVYADGTVPVLFLSDYAFTCSDAQDLIEYGFPADSADLHTVIGTLQVGLNIYSTQTHSGLGDLEEDVYRVTNYQTSVQVHEGELLAVSAAFFASNDGATNDLYLPEGGDLEVEIIDLPDSVSGTFKMKFGSAGTFSGEFNVEECN